mmetsp:Transcript_43322/g.139213  ORF Transcript_43322/g.139213 Transcript_43322/m.139213 type:complete len:369 (-) Transcript_43322:776-1882(-)
MRQRGWLLLLLLLLLVLRSAGVRPWGGARTTAAQRDAALQAGGQSRHANAGWSSCPLLHFGAAGDGMHPQLPAQNRILLLQLLQLLHVAHAGDLRRHSQWAHRSEARARLRTAGRRRGHAAGAVVVRTDGGGAPLALDGLRGALAGPEREAVGAAAAAAPADAHGRGHAHRRADATSLRRRLRCRRCDARTGVVVLEHDVEAAHELLEGVLQVVGDQRLLLELCQVLLVRLLALVRDLALQLPQLLDLRRQQHLLPRADPGQPLLDTGDADVQVAVCTLALEGLALQAHAQALATVREDLNNLAHLVELSQHLGLPLHAHAAGAGERPARRDELDGGRELAVHVVAARPDVMPQLVRECLDLGSEGQT